MVLTKPRLTPPRTAHWPEVVERPENRLAVQAVRRLERQLARPHGKTPFHPLLLCGPSGTGKTLLVTALVKRVIALPAVRTVQTVPAHDLTPAPDGSAGDVEFDDLERVDLLIIEDVQHLAKSSILPVCRLLDARGRRRLATVITSNASPNQLTKLPQRLISRLTGGLVTPLAPLGVASRECILLHAAEAKNLRLTADAVKWLAAKPTGGGLRPLLGQLDLIKSLARGHATAFTVEELKTLFRNVPRPPETLALDRIVQRVAQKYQVKPKDLLGPSRLRTVLRARQVAMALARDLTPLTLPSIGDYFDGRDHTTVLHAVRKVAMLADDDRQFAAAYRELKSQLG